MIDPFTVVTGVAALAGFGAAGRMRWRAARAESELNSLAHQLEAERHAARHDPLTGLPNRRAFYQMGAAVLAEPDRQPLTAVMLDLDDFKQVNDTFGHAAGDQVLIAVAHRFAEFAGDNLVGRLGGDEFAGLLRVPDDRRWMDQVARQLMEVLAAPIQIGRMHLRVTTSVGLVPVVRPVPLAEALRRADAAMYRMKSIGPTCLTSTNPVRVAEA
jgi:diguanylate cyclase (GGDEF)-like protein